MPKIRMPGEAHDRLVVLKVSQAKALREQLGCSFNMDDKDSILQKLLLGGKEFAMSVAALVLKETEETLDELDSNVMYQFVEDLIVDFLPPLTQKAIRAQINKMMENAEGLISSSPLTPWTPATSSEG